jgi:predicted Zn-dependent peptidase
MLKMHRIARIFGILIPLVLASCASSHSTEEITLENGLRVVFIRIHSPIVSAVFLMNYGEIDGLPGFARKTNELLLKGTDIRNSEQVYQEIESLGGIIGTETGLSSSIATVQAPVSNFAECFQILCECLARSTFDSTEFSQPDFNTAGDFQYKESLILKKQARRDIEIRKRLYPGSEFGSNLVSSSGKYSREQILEFARIHVRPQNMVLSVAGDYPKRQVINTIKRNWKIPANRQAFAPFDTSQALPYPALSSTRSAGSKDTVFMAIKGRRPFSGEFLLDNLVEIALSIEKSGPLAASLAGEGIRETEIQFYSQFEDDYSYSVIQAVVPRGQGNRTLDIVGRELNHILKTGIPDALFQTAKRRLESTLAIRSQYTLDNAWFSALTSALNLPCRTFNSVQTRVQQITLEQVNRHAGRMAPRFLLWNKTSGKR